MNKKTGVFILTVGDELLDGRVVNTNASFFGEELRRAGIPVAEIRSVSDRLSDLVPALQAAAEYPLALVSGGLGPTNDDRTALAAAQAFGRPLAATSASLAHVKRRYRLLKRKINKIRLRQALLPSRARLLQNPNGTAPGFILRENKSELFFVPGVPSECRPLFMREFLPRAQKIATRRCVRREFWRTFGAAEGDLYASIAKLMEPMEKKFPRSVQFGVHIAFPGVDITLEVWEIPGVALPADSALDALTQAIGKKLSRFVYSRTRESLVEVVGRLLRERGQSIATAESCTGGMLGKLLTDIPGSSQFYWGGVVSYANGAKEKLLGISPALLRRHGAVSKETAQTMAENIRLISGADYSLSLTGVSGPGGGTDTKPVGTIYVGFSDSVCTKTLHRVFAAGRLSREQNRTFAVHFALDSLRQELLR